MEAIKLGARTFKTGLAVILAIYISNFLGLNPVVYAAIAAVLTVQPSVYRSWRYMFEQVQANLVGAVVAITALYYLGDDPIIIGLVVVIVISINLALKLDKSVGIAILTVIAIMEVPEGESILFAITRFELIMIGVSSSILINFLFMPPKYEKKLVDQIRRTNDKILSFLRVITDGEVDEKVYNDEKEKIKEDLDRVGELYVLYKEEFNSRIIKPKYSDARKLVVFKNFNTTANTAYQVIEAVQRHYFSSTNVPEILKDSINEHLHLIANYNEKLMFKYDKKIKIPSQFSRNKELFESNNDLKKKILKYYTQTNEESWFHVFPIISSMIELSNDLDHLGKLINSLHNHHKEK